MYTRAIVATQFAFVLVLPLLVGCPGKANRPGESPSTGERTTTVAEGSAPESSPETAPTTQPESGPICTGESCDVGEGSFRQSKIIGSSGTGPAQFDSPVGIAAAGDAIYVADTGNNRVQQLTLDGNFVREWKNLPRPMHLSVADDGTLAVPLYLDDQVLLLDPAGKERRRMGGEWLDAPAGAVPSNEGWWVVDFYHHRIHRLSQKGEVQVSFGGKGEADGKFTYPTDLAVAPDGTIWVADAYGHRLQAFARDGTFKRVLGAQGSAAGNFDTPIGLDVCAAGRIYVADSGNNRVQVFGPEGNIEAVLGADVLDRPQDVAVLGANVYIVDHGHDRIVVYQ